MALYTRQAPCKTYIGSFNANAEIEVTTEVAVTSYPSYIRFVAEISTLTKKKRLAETVYAVLESYGSEYPMMTQWLRCGENADATYYSLSTLTPGASQALGKDGAKVYTGSGAYWASFYTDKSAFPPYVRYVLEDIIPDVRNLYPISFVDETKPAIFGWEFYAEMPESGVPLVQKSALLQWRSADGTVHEIAVSGETQSYTFAANTFPANESIQWRVQVTSDDDIASEWSAWQTVSTIENAGVVSDLYPADILVNGEVINRVSWKYINEYGTEQSAYDLEKSIDGTTWTSLSSESTSNQYYDVPAGTFVTEKAWIRVRAYNSSGVASEWISASFTVRSSPPKPSIISVSADTDKPLIVWESTGQEAYEITICNDNGETLYSKSLAGTEKRHKITLRLEDGSYIASLKIRNKYNLVSPAVQRAFAISTVKPDKPSLYAAQSDGGVGITFTHTTDKAVLLRNGLVIADVSGLSSYIDYTSHGACKYVLRALSDDSFCDSEPYEVTVGFGYALISAVDNPADCLRLRFKAGSAPENRTSTGAESASLSFAGRQYPVTEFGEHRSFSKSLSYSVLVEQDLQKLLSLIGQIVLWRDRKDKFYGALTEVNFTRRRSYIDVSFTISKQNISEEISYE